MNPSVHDDPAQDVRRHFYQKTNLPMHNNIDIINIDYDSIYRKLHSVEKCRGAKNCNHTSVLIKFIIIIEIGLRRHLAPPVHDDPAQDIRRHLHQRSEEEGEVLVVAHHRPVVAQTHVDRLVGKPAAKRHFEM